jgi:hypothetical protein
MAKSRTLDQAIDELMKNYTNALQQAVEYATSKASDDIYKYSMSCLNDYYENYDPLRYHRSYSLWHGVLPYSEIRNNGKEIISRVGVEYNPFVLAAYVEGNPAYSGSSHYDPVDTWYVLENYLEGIHPATDGSGNENAIYYENIDPESPTDKMEKYLNNYVSTTFNDNVLVSFAKQITKMK